MQCPKCATEARDVAKFCPRCHTTLRYQCPSCKNEQRHGGNCEHCGIDFLKYIGAMLANKKAETDLIHERVERRSSLLKHILWTPFTAGVPLLRYFFGYSRKEDRDRAA